MWDVVDLFSGGGGASAGFHLSERFRIVGAADAQYGKPSSGMGALSCNDTYRANIGKTPVEADLGSIDADALGGQIGLVRPPTVLIACPPCTGFTRTNANNHIRDDDRNSLVGRVGAFVAAWRPTVVVMENARELVMGRFRGHLHSLQNDLQRMGYTTHAATHMLSDFGLPQRRERAFVIAVSKGLRLRTLNDLWDGWVVDDKATHVRRAIWNLPPVQPGERHPDDPMHVAPALRDPVAKLRTAAIPHDGGSWIDLAGSARTRKLMTPGQRARLASGKTGSHPDPYGRMWWDRPAPTIKRECSHVGNGRYTHPEQDRLATVREMGILNGFPADYTFHGSLANMYRHIGDAVPPLISYQVAALVNWILTGVRPAPHDWVLPNTHLQASDIYRRDSSPEAGPSLGG